MLFRKQLSVRETRVRQGAGLTLTVGDVQVSLAHTTYDHDNQPLLRLEAVCERTPPDAVRDWLLASADNETLPSPPDNVWAFTGPLLGELHGACTRAFEVLRWRTGSDTPHTPYASLGDYFSEDGGNTWHRINSRGSAVGWQIFGLPLTDRIAAEVTALLADPDLREPIGHVLLREAEDSRSMNPRSAVILGVAALETSIKDTIADLVPGSEWLVENMPSPPVPKLLKDYLPTLPAKLTVNGLVHPPPKAARRAISKAVEERNRVAHRGQLSMDHREVLTFVRFVRSTLYLLDYYRGHDWAWNEIDRDYRAGLGT